MRCGHWTLAGVLEIRPRRIADERGFFSEVWNKERWREAGIDIDFVQDNHSLSKQSEACFAACIIRRRRWPQAKLVRVTRGAVFDVAVDIRAGSPDLRPMGVGDPVGRTLEPAVHPGISRTAS